MAQAHSGLHTSRPAARLGALDTLARTLFLRSLQGLQGAGLHLEMDGEVQVYGDPSAPLQARAVVHDPRTFRLGLFRGEVGLGEAYVAGAWSSPDPVALVQLAVRNMRAFDDGGGLLGKVGKALARLRHLRRANTREGSRQNIHAHYDLGNAFYGQWLDPSMAYSSAFFEGEASTLEEAQVAKFDRICRQLDLQPGDHLLEIGTGWGGFAIHAARHYGCRVTTTTLSREQHAWARDWVAREGLEDRITLLLQDYRDLQGTFDKAVSIEMFEAVGLAFYDTYFGTVDRLLAPGGLFLVQTITMNDRRFPDYIRSTDWIQQYIFPGAELASLREIHQSLPRCSRFDVARLEDMGQHYARTLAEWRRRFHAAWPTIEPLGFDAPFRRLWDWYLASCEGAFRERTISVVQLLLARSGTHHPLPGEPWRQP